MEEKIIIAGFGGQGVILAGNVLAETAVSEGKNITAMVSYGVEMRGGTANCAVVISDDEIASPVLDEPTVAIVLNEPSLDKFENKVTKGGLIIVNTTMINRELKRKDVDILEIPATKIASDMGNVKVANLILIGAFIKKSGILNLEHAIASLQKALPPRKQNMVEINKKALQKGVEICS